jgi:hypothetical protein
MQFAKGRRLLLACLSVPVVLFVLVSATDIRSTLDPSPESQRSRWSRIWMSRRAGTSTGGTSGRRLPELSAIPREEQQFSIQHRHVCGHYNKCDRVGRDIHHINNSCIATGSPVRKQHKTRMRSRMFNLPNRTRVTEKYTANHAKKVRGLRWTGFICLSSCSA